ncbi:Kazal-type serine protease inhibitor [Streptomyces sp. T-3]|nr:Kazal-type serine protease inhibitor [Streptomyces sp. T-3]
MTLRNTLLVAALALTAFGATPAGGAAAAEPVPPTDGTPCTSRYQPVCTSGGITYGNACEAAQAGATVVREGRCDGSVGALWPPAPHVERQPDCSEHTVIMNFR